MTMPTSSERSPGRGASGTQRQDLYAVLKVYETVKTDVAYVQDKTVSQIQAKDRILEYLKHKPSITNQKAQELCGYTKDQAYRILRKLVEEGKIEVKGAGRGRRYCLKENQR